VLKENVLTPHGLVVIPRVRRSDCGHTHREEISTLFDLLDSNDTDALVSFLETSKGMGINPLVIIIDMWKTWRAILAKVLPGDARQLCVSSAVRCLVEHTYKNVLTYYCELPEETEAQRAAKKRLWDLRHLLLGASPSLTARQQGDVEDLLQAHRGTVLDQAYDCKEAIIALFRASQTKEEARTRRDRIVQRFGDVSELKEAIELIQVDEFEQMIGYLWGKDTVSSAPRTSTSLLQTRDVPVQTVAAERDR
jgi:hypothetical protein